jgi:putative heme-binding domain-containing protein
MYVAVTLVARVSFAQRDLKNIPPPDAKLEQATFVVPEGFEVNLFAADPQMAKPIQMNFDARGRLWIASSEVYPHIKPGQKATDKILVLEDVDRDGKAEKLSVFADDLLIPTGVLPGDGGAYVVNSTELLHLRDTDGDGKSDRRRIVLSGFGAEDTHHLLHTLRWGHDGALYMNQSIYIHSHVETPYGVKRLNGGGIWRYQPDQQKLEIVCRGFVNPWGHHTDYWGQSFATDGAYGEGVNYVFPGAVYVTAPGAKRRLQGLNPGSPKHCGLEILSGRHLPPEWRGTMITNDFRAHRVCRFVVSENGAGYSSRQEVEVIKSDHVAFRPIDVKMGPDGAIYIADWYNPIIQHGEVDFRDERRDHVHGRIWRVTAKDRPLLRHPDLVETGVPQLLNHLKAEEDWVRLHAKLQLKRRNHKRVLSSLASWMERLPADDAQYEHHLLEGLWVHEALGAPNWDLLDRLFRSSDHRVRAAAVRAVVWWSDHANDDGDALNYFRAAIEDDHPRVRLEAVRGLSSIPSTDAARLALKALNRPMDRFLDFALWQAMRDLEPIWLAEVRTGKLDFDGNVDHLTFALRSVESPDVVRPLIELLGKRRIAADRQTSVVALAASLGEANQLQALLAHIAAQSKEAPEMAAASLTALVDTARPRRIAPPAPGKPLESLLASKSTALQAAALRAAGAWKQVAWQPRLDKTALDKAAQPNIRSAAIVGLGWLANPASVESLTAVTESGETADRVAAVRALTEANLERAALRAVAVIGDLPKGGDPQALIAPFLIRKRGPQTLTRALKDQKWDADKGRLAVRAAQRTSQPNATLIAALRKTAGLADAGWKLTDDLLKELVAEVAERGNPTRGEAIYRRAELQCEKCHAIGGSGGRVGPDLVSVGASAQLDYLVESMLAPDKKVKENFHSVVVQTDEGKIIAGVPLRKTAAELVLRDGEDREVTIPVDAIEEQKEGRSLMPDGSVDALTRGELVDLISFLSKLGKLGDFAIGKERVARTWRVLLPTPAAMHRIRRTSFDTAAKEDPAFTYLNAYSTVAGDLPTANLPFFNAPTYVTRKDSVKTAFVRTALDVTQPGVVRLSIGSTEGLLVWIDGKPTPPKENLDIAFAKGRHSVTFAVDVLGRSEPLRLELLDAPDSTAQAALVKGK